MKHIATYEVIQMMVEEVVDRYYWGTPDKALAEKIRKDANNALMRRNMSDKFIVTVFPVLKPNLTVLHITAVEPRENINEKDNPSST